MGFRINTNVDALNAYYALDKVNKETTKSQLRLASGKRINNVADDTSGFNIGKSLEGRLAVMKGALNNVSAAKDLLNTAEGSLLAANDLLIKIQGKLSDATNPTASRSDLAKDINALANEINSTLTNTKFNNTKLLSGTGDTETGFVFQVGADFTDKLTLNFAAGLTTGTSSTAFAASLNQMVSAAEGNLTNSNNLTSLTDHLATLQNAIKDALGLVGNFTQRLDIKEQTLNISVANAQSSYSRIFDADMAMEQLNATRGTIIGQAATAMVAQLNSAPQQVLSLFN